MHATLASALDPDSIDWRLQQQLLSKPPTADKYFLVGPENSNARDENQSLSESNQIIFMYLQLVEFFCI